MSGTRYNVALVEVLGLAPALVVGDLVLKASGCDLLAAEATGGQETLLKFSGDAGQCRRAAQVARQEAERLRVPCLVTVRLQFRDGEQVEVIRAAQEYSGINDGYVNLMPEAPRRAGQSHEDALRAQQERRKQNPNWKPNMQAIGFLETQGLTAVLEGTDAMLKAASVEVVGKEKIGAAHVTIMVRGDVAAVQAAVAAGKTAAEKVGKVVAAHVIARPHEGLARLLPQ